MIATAASTTIAMCTMKVTCSGDGAYATRIPASSGPAPRPPVAATVATAIELRVMGEHTDHGADVDPSRIDFLGEIDVRPLHDDLVASGKRLAMA
jgi:hypothetical protein